MKTNILLIGLVFTAVTVLAHTQTKSTGDKPWRVYQASDTQNLDNYARETWTLADDDGDHATLGGDVSYDEQIIHHYDHNWRASTNGQGSKTNIIARVYWDGFGYHWTNSRAMSWTNGESGVETVSDESGSVMTNNIGRPTIGDEHCNVNDPKNPPPTVYVLEGGVDYLTNTYRETYTRKADTVWRVQTGGKAVPGLLNLWQFTGSAWEVVDKRAVPPFGNAPMTEITNKPDIAIGCMGNLLTNGVRYNLLPNNAVFDVTPKVAGKDFYTFSVSGQKYLSYFDVFVLQANPGYSFFPAGENDYGHVFWQFRTEAPDDALQYIATNLTMFLGKKWGFYPTNDPLPSLWNLQIVQGVLQNDGPPTAHDYNIKRSFYISFLHLLDGLSFTKRMNDAPPNWSATGIDGYSCVSATQSAGAYARVFALPMDFSPQNFGITLIRMYPAPGQTLAPLIDTNGVFYSATPY